MMKIKLYLVLLGLSSSVVAEKIQLQDIIQLASQHSLSIIDARLNQEAMQWNDGVLFDSHLYQARISSSYSSHAVGMNGKGNTISATGSRTYPTGTKFEVNGQINPATDFSKELRSVGIEIQQDLWRNQFGQETQLQKKRFSLSRQAQDFQTRLVENDNLINVIRNAKNVVAAQQRLEVTRTILEKETQMASIYRKRFRDGMIPKGDKLRIDDRLLTARSHKEGEHLSLEDAWMTLLMSMGSSQLQQQGLDSMHLVFSSSPLELNQGVCQASLSSSHIQLKVFDNQRKSIENQLETRRESVKPQLQVGIGSAVQTGGRTESSMPAVQVKLSLQAEFKDLNSDREYQKQLIEKRRLVTKEKRWRQDWNHHKERICRKYDHLQLKAKLIQQRIDTSYRLLVDTRESYENGIGSLDALSLSEQSHLQLLKDQKLNELEVSMMSWELYHHLGEDLSILSGRVQSRET